MSIHSSRRVRIDIPQCRTSYLHLTPNIFFRAIHSSPRGPDRIPTVSTKTAFTSETKLRLPQYTLPRQEPRSVTYGCYLLFPPKTKHCLTFFFLLFLSFLFVFSWIYTRTSHSRYLPRSIIIRFIPVFVLFSFLFLHLRDDASSQPYTVKTLPISLSSEILPRRGSARDTPQSALN